MYAIGYFIYGINLMNVPDRLSEEINDLAGADIVSTKYSGSGDEPCFIGVEVDQLDECSELSWAKLVKGKEKLSAASKVDSPEAVEFRKLLKTVLDEELSDDLRNWLTTQEPEIFLTWGTS